MLEAKNIVVKPADNSKEVEGFYRCRFKNYLLNGYLTKKDFTKEQLEKEQEYDEYDALESTTYIVLKKAEQVVGGVRIIGGSNLPIKTAIVSSSKKPLNFDLFFPSKEISRLVIDSEYRFPQVLTNTLRMIAILVYDEPMLVCTSQRPQIPLYQSLGFELLRDDYGVPLKIEYRLSGEWYPLVRSKKRVSECAHLIEGFSSKFFKRILEPIEGIPNQAVIEYVIKNNPCFGKK